MPAPQNELLVTQAEQGISVRLEPAYNVIQSLKLLYRHEHFSGLGDWIYQTAAAMTAEEWENHRLVIEGLFYAVSPEGSWSSFPAYMDHLATVPPESLVDKLLNAYLNLPCKNMDGDGSPLLTERDEILQDVNSYLRFLRQHFSAEWLNVEIERRAYTYVIDPPALQKLVVEHLRHMWHKYVAVEWETVRPLLQKSVEAFQQVEFSGMSRIEAINMVLGRPLEDTKWMPWRDESDQLVFVPSAHIGPYTGSLWDGNTLYVVFGARLPEGTGAVVPELSRAELLVRLSALADDTRLSILKLVAEEGELRSGDIIQMLNLSQSAASRHLQQLSATGFLTERRCQGAKCYQLNQQRIENTLLAAATYLSINQLASNHLIEDFSSLGLATQPSLAASSGSLRPWRGRMGGHHELV